MSAPLHPEAQTVRNALIYARDNFGGIVWDISCDDALAALDVLEGRLEQAERACERHYKWYFEANEKRTEAEAELERAHTALRAAEPFVRACDHLGHTQPHGYPCEWHSGFPCTCGKAAALEAAREALGALGSPAPSSQTPDSRCWCGQDRSTECWKCEGRPDS